MDKVLGISLLLVCSVTALGQQLVTKYTTQIRADVGYSFPSFTTNQSQWKGVFYPAGALTVALRRRFRSNWQSELGVGVTGYALVNKGPYDRYILDFASPHIVTALGYIKSLSKKTEAFIQLANGMQLGYNKEVGMQNQQYTVRIKGESPLYFFVQPIIGISNRFKKKVNGFALGYQIGAFYRYNINSLGRVEFIDDQSTVVAIPGGDIIGIQCAVSIPTGKQKIMTSSRMTWKKSKQTSPTLPSRHTPRML